MSNGTVNVYERLFKLFVKIGMMILDSRRVAEEVARWLQRIVERPDFVSILDQPASASVVTEPVGGWASEWSRFYREVFDMEANFEGVKLSDEQDCFGWTVFIAPSITLNMVWAACRDQFPCNSYLGDDLDRMVLTNAGTSNAAYPRRFRNRVEADEETKKMSANYLATRDVLGITLMERMLMELWYHWKTGGGHLDLLNVTLCAGSRYADGNVPGADWRESQFQLDGYDPGYANGDLRTRSAV